MAVSARDGNLKYIPVVWIPAVHAGMTGFVTLVYNDERRSVGTMEFWLEPVIDLAQNFGLSAQELREAYRTLVHTNRRLEMLGTNISPVEISGVSKHGFWLLLDEEEELFVSFLEFPWFRKAPVEALFDIDRPQPHHLYWPQLDVDLHIDSIRHPERYPLLSRAAS